MVGRGEVEMEATAARNLRCKFQFGTTVIEIEGIGSEDTRIVDKIVELMDAVIGSALTDDILPEDDQSTDDVVKTDETTKDEKSAKPEKKETRGGKRIPWISPKLEELCKLGLIVNVTPDDVAKMIKDKWAANAPRAGVTMALNRRLNDTIIRSEDPPGSGNYKYTYSPPRVAPSKEAPKTP